MLQFLILQFLVALQALQAPLVQQDHRGQQVPKALQERQALMVRMVQTAQQQSALERLQQAQQAAMHL